MSMRGAVGGLLIVAILSGSIGTPDDPELLDLTGDFAYEPSYLGPRDHAQADIEKLWIDYDPVRDLIGLHLQVPGMQRLEQLGADWSYQCGLVFNMTVDGVFNGQILAGWTWNGPRGEESTHVSYYEELEPSPSTAPRKLSHEFELVLGEPGIYFWRIDRSAAQLHGEELTDIEANCNAAQYVAGLPLQIAGFDEAKGQRSFDLEELEPAATSEPAETHFTSTVSTSPTWDEEVGPTSALGLVAAIVIVFGVALFRRKE